MTDKEFEEKMCVSIAVRAIEHILQLVGQDVKNASCEGRLDDIRDTHTRIQLSVLNLISGTFGGVGQETYADHRHAMLTAFRRGD